VIPSITRLANSVIYTFPYTPATAQYVADVQNNRPVEVDGVLP